MADFCACCTARLGVEPELNDFNSKPEMLDSEIDFDFLVNNYLCEGCGHVVAVDLKGFPVTFDKYFMEVSRNVVHIGKNQPYQILHLANATTENYPHMVVYQNIDTKEVYTRWLPVFVRKFKPEVGSWYND